MRLPKLIIENIRKKAGDSLAILCRINATDDVEGGQTAQDAAAVASYLEKECGVDGLHLSRAVHLHDECMWAPSLIHGGFSADYVTEIKRAVSVPIITVGRYTEPPVCRADGCGGQSRPGCLRQTEHRRPRNAQ